MATHPGQQAESSSSRRRRSMFARSPLSMPTLSDIGNNRDKDKGHSAVLKKRRTPSWFSGGGPLIEQEADENGSVSPLPPMPSMRDGGRRSTSLFNSLRSTKSTDESEEPLSTTSMNAPSIDWSESTSIRKNVLHHGEVQTSTSMFRKKREYIVLTESHLVRMKSQQKASERFSSIPPQPGRASMTRHKSGQSQSSLPDLQTLSSDASGERDIGTPLRSIVAVQLLDDGRPYFAIEIDYLDDETNSASSLTIQLPDPTERDAWLSALRSAANKARLSDPEPWNPFNSHTAARVVEREGDYDPAQYAIYKVVQRPAKAGRSSSDDLPKVGSAVCFMAIGIHKVHMIPLFKGPHRASNPSLAALYNVQASYGILTITSMRLSEADDTFELTFRKPLTKSRTLHLASLAGADIAARLRQVEGCLRPEWESRPYSVSAPPSVLNDILDSAVHPPMDEESFDRTLCAYCVAYGFNPTYIAYKVSYPAEDSPQFQLLPPADTRRRTYHILELLAVMRALRYNESYGSISFANVPLDSLNGLRDPYGAEHLCLRTKRGTILAIDPAELESASLLVQELRALAITSKRLRRMDFSSTIQKQPQEASDGFPARGDGCGIVEALFPLCRVQITNVDWIILNNIRLSDSDMDYMVSGAVDRKCHFRALEMSRCGLTDRSLMLVMEAMRAQDTLEAINISGNAGRLTPSALNSWIGVFAYIRKLDLSHLSRTASDEPLVTAETLLAWKLEEFVLSGTALNEASVSAIAKYLESPQSNYLRDLRLDHTFITGKDVATLMRSMTEKANVARVLHLDVSLNPLEKGHEQLATAIAGGLAPTNLMMQKMDYQVEHHFGELLLALSLNSTVQVLDISRITIPCNISSETCEALQKLFSDNKTLEFLDISGEESRIESTALGNELCNAVKALEKNTALRVLRIQFQDLGMEGAFALANVLRSNSTLQELHCENNKIQISGFTELANSLHQNTSILYLPTMDDVRRDALAHAEAEVKSARGHHITPPQPSASRASGVKERIASRVGLSTKEPDCFQLSPQDIAAALRLVDESWRRQAHRLEQYLARNANLAQGIPVPMEIDEEDFERDDRNQRVDSADVQELMKRAQVDSTPTTEKEALFSTAAEKEALFSTSGTNSVLTTDSDEAVAPLAADLEKALLDSKRSKNKSHERQLSSVEPGTPESCKGEPKSELKYPGT